MFESKFKTFKPELEVRGNIKNKLWIIRSLASFDAWKNAIL